MLPLSIFVITKNEEARLPRTLDTLVGWASEIVVVDSGSSDKTVEIAKQYGARIFHRSWVGYGNQKRYAEQQCYYDWVLNLDADEVVTPELKEEIEAVFAQGGDAPRAYRIKILNVYPGNDKPRRFANDYNVVRLYHRRIASYRDHPVYDRVELKEGNPRQLRGVIYHFPHVSFGHAIAKLNTFSDFRAVHSKRRSILSLKLRIITEFPVVFLKFYLFRRHCFGGWKGLYFSLCQAFMRTSRVAKMLEAAQG